MRAVLRPALLIASFLSFATAAVAEEVPSAPSPDDTPEADPSEAGEPQAEAMPLPATVDEDGRDDHEPPLIEDVAVAANSPSTAPLITAVITDDWSGVERAHVYFRRLGGGAFEQATLSPGSGGLFIARLPDGTQTTGFEYYVEVWDAANNGPARLGTPEKPLRVEPASEGTLTRLEREQAEREMGPVHPAWMMLSLGGGLLAAAGSGIFWLDFATSQGRLAEETDPGVRRELENALLGDAVIGSVLGAIAVAGLATGIGLLVYAALEE